MLIQATERFPVDPSAYKLLADLAETEGDVVTARDALIKYELLTGETDTTRLSVLSAES